MSFALYIDPGKRNASAPGWPEARPSMIYWRLVDLTLDELHSFDFYRYPAADFSIAEIHPAQWDVMDMGMFQRVSIDTEKSKFTSLSRVRPHIAEAQYDITFNWDHRFHVSYYFKMLQYWIQCGIQHVSFYGLTDFNKWQRLREFLAQNNFHFYDRYHACLPGFESPYQKHVARFGDLYALGGFSRVTENGMTRVKDWTQKDWQIMSPAEQLTERLLFALADRDGISTEGLKPKGIETATASGLAALQNGRLVPTDKGLWDTVGLVSQVQQG